jgi:hypothetical protein
VDFATRVTKEVLGDAVNTICQLAYDNILRPVVTGSPVSPITLELLGERQPDSFLTGLMHVDTEMGQMSNVDAEEWDPHGTAATDTVFGEEEYKDEDEGEDEDVDEDADEGEDEAEDEDTDEGEDEDTDEEMSG